MAYDQLTLKGATSQLIEVMLRDSTTGQGKTAIVAAGVTAYYIREGGAANAAMVLDGTMSLGTWKTLGWVEVDAAHQPGLYQLGIPDAAIATGANAVTITLTATGVIGARIRLILLDADLRNATTLGLANLDAAVSSRNATTPPTVTAIRTEMDANSAKLANLDAAISTRTKPADTQTVGAVTVSDKTGFSLTSAYDAAKTAGSQASITALGSPLQASGYTIPPTATENADTLLKRDWTAITGEAAHSVLNALRFLRNKWSVAGTGLTVMKEDGSTTAWSGTVSTDSSAPPVTGNTPST